MFRAFVTSVRRHPLRSLLLTLLSVAILGPFVVLGYAEYHWRSAQRALREDRPEEAVSHLQTCLWLSPDSVKVRLVAARAYRLAGKIPEAEEQLQKVMKLQGGPSDATQLEYLLMRVQAGETDDVEPALLGLVDAKHPEAELILETLARSHMHHLRYGPAYVCLNRWLEINPDLAKIYHWRGWVLERVNKAKLALVDYERALELDPDLFKVRLRVAEMHLEDSNPPKAIPHLERLLRDHSHRADVRAKLGQCRFLQGKIDEAREHLEFALKETPNDAVLLLQLAKIELLENNPAAAEPLLRRVIENDPGDTEARYQLVSCLNKLGKTEESNEALKQYERYKAVLDNANKLLREEGEKPTNDPASAHAIGAALLELERDKLALHWLHEALKRNEKYVPTHQLLAEYYTRRGESNKAAVHQRYLPSSK